ncbi:MAG: GAF domain-containing protein, partial [Planctomycetaceae bacterium]|nr:GAF domain-containing protein [Planctomycetaceae bacterium]
ESRDVIFIDDIGSVSDCCRAPAARAAGVRSGICFPIVLNGNVVGTMDFFSNQTLELSEDRLAVFRAVARLVSTAMTRLRNLEAQAEAKQNSDAVAEVIRVITSADNSEEAIRLTLNAVRQCFGWKYGSFWRIDPARNALVFETDSGTVNHEFRDITAQASFTRGVGLAGRAWSERTLQYTSDIGQVQDCCRAPIAKRAGVRAGICFPIVLSGEVRGTMDFFTLDSIQLSQGRLDALKLVGELVSQSLGKLIEAEHTRRRSVELQSGIHEVLSVVGSATRTMELLDESGLEIGGVIKVISDIAEQTNLLALNATIESARAGTAGKGFAVVAQEVKSLAQETSKSTSDISQRVDSIRDASRGAIAAIAEIGRIMNEIQVENV